MWKYLTNTSYISQQNSTTTINPTQKPPVHITTNNVIQEPYYRVRSPLKVSRKPHLRPSTYVHSGYSATILQKPQERSTRILPEKDDKIYETEHKPRTALSLLMTINGKEQITDARIDS